MGNIITYCYIIPRVWKENYTHEELINMIWDQLEPYTLGDQNYDFGPIITVAGVTTILRILHHRFCWWFALPGDQIPTEEKYRYSNNFLNVGNWAMRDVVMVIVDDEENIANNNGNDDDDIGDADTVILDNLNDNDLHYQWDLEETARLQAIRNRQFQLLNRMRHGVVDPNADEGIEFEPLFEEKEDEAISSCQDPNSKIAELNREKFHLKNQIEELQEHAA
ncbi:putative Bracovirus protein MdBV-19-1 [Microplitis demolitor]